MAIFTVTNLTDQGSGSLRQAIADSNARLGPDIIEFTPALSGTIYLSGQELKITDSLTINAPGADHLTIDARQQSRVLHVDNTEFLGLEVALNGLTLTGGRTTGKDEHGGGISNNGRLTLNDIIVTGNSTTGHYAKGGGIANISTIHKVSPDTLPTEKSIFPILSELVVRHCPTKE